MPMVDAEYPQEPIAQPPVLTITSVPQGRYLVSQTASGVGTFQRDMNAEQVLDTVMRYLEAHAEGRLRR